MVKLRAFRVLMAALLPAFLGAQSHRAEGFDRLPEGAVVAIMPLDVELYAVTAGGVREPKAEWTEAARKNILADLEARSEAGKVTFKAFTGEAGPEIAELGHLRAAVSNAIWIHHFGTMKLPGKEGRLDWTLGEPAAAISRAMPADFALYVTLRDSTATGGRVATMVLMAAFGVAAPGGGQAGEATLVDLKTGRVVWYNRMFKATGDVREPVAAHAALDNLLVDFPGKGK
ncbi:MAG TPA: hypothetical protein VK188_19185 [Holophaga sp.]|nr:hypothetical protein [Holophaga sp.]